jgi:trimethylamine--corrinoid protein Co-methyltransferase
VVDEEIAQWVRRLAQGVDAGQGKDLFEDIKLVGPGGHFLKSRNTRLAPRSGEFYIDRLMPRGSYESWVEAGKPSMYQRARQRVSEILAGPVIDPLPGDVSDKLEEIVRRAAKELKDSSE